MKKKTYPTATKHREETVEGTSVVKHWRHCVGKGDGFVCSTPLSAFRFCIFGNLSKQRAKQSSPENKVSLMKQNQTLLQEGPGRGQISGTRVPTDRQPWCTGSVTPARQRRWLKATTQTLGWVPLKHPIKKPQGTTWFIQSTIRHSRGRRERP